MKWLFRIVCSFLVALTFSLATGSSFAADDAAKPLVTEKVSRLAKGAACILALGAIVKSYTLPHYVPKPDEISPYLTQYSLPPHSLDPWDYNSAKNLRLASGLGREVFGYVFGPLTTTMDLMGRRMIHRTPMGAIKETVHEDFRYLLGYFLLYAALRRMNKTYFHIDVDNYDAASGAGMKPNPKKVLYLSSVPEGDRLAGFPEFHFQRYYGNHPDAHFMEFGNLDDLVAKLAALPQDGSYDRIEIFMHGRPNKVYAADKSKIAPTDLARLLNAKLNIATPGADIRFVACSLAGGRPFDPRSSEIFIREFGNALLSRGGQVIAASRAISVVDSFYPPSNWADRQTAHRSFMNRSMSVMVHTMGLGNFRYLWYEVLPNLYRNYRNSRQDAIVVQIH